MIIKCIFWKKKVYILVLAFAFSGELLLEVVVEWYKTGDRSCELYFASELEGAVKIEDAKIRR